MRSGGVTVQHHKYVQHSKLRNAKDCQQPSDARKWQERTFPIAVRGT